MTIEILIGIASGLFGAMVTMLIFIFPLLSRLAKLETSMQFLGTQITELKNAKPGFCTAHNEIDRQAAVNEEKIQALNERVTTLEQNQP